MLEWIENHFNTLRQLQLNTVVTNQEGNLLTLGQGFTTYIDTVMSVQENNNKIFFIGNGGSAGIASHLAIDYSKNGRMPSLAFSDAAAVTCLSNDYGYEHVFAKQIEFLAQAKDILIAISSSGKSQNILNAVQTAKAKSLSVITFSGFESNNPLRQMGILNFFTPCKSYGFVEVTHIALAHAMLDYITDKEMKTEKLTAIA